MSDICTVRKSTLDGIARQTQRLTGSTEQMKAGEIAVKLEDVPSQPAKGLVFSEYDSDGYPHKAEFVGEWSGTAQTVHYIFNKGDLYFGHKITSITIPAGITKLPQSMFHSCSALQEINLPNTLTTIQGTYNFYMCECPVLVIPASVKTFESNQQFSGFGGKRVIFQGQLPNVPNSCFVGCGNVEEYDFSNCTTIPTLYSARSISGKSTGYVIKIPLALSDQTLGAGNGWESATNWSGLTNIVWEAV